MRRKHVLAACMLLALLALLASGRLASRAAQAKPPASPRSTVAAISDRRTEGPVAARSDYQSPKLLVMLVIDQFRYDYLMRFRPYFVDNGVVKGFNLLLSGANFLDCRFDYATLATCPGHATLFTGAYPNVHGVIANDWWDRATQHRLYCASDPDTTEVGGTPGPGFSPRNLIGSTIGDELRMATGFRSKVIAISLKDRASVMPGGHLANAAYWYDSKSGEFVSSTYYMSTLPDWVSQFNRSEPARKFCGQSWQALPVTPEAGGKILKSFKAAPNEPCPDAKFLGWLDSTPAMNKIELDFAEEAVRNERLGRGAGTDLLTLSLSVNDYIGHAYGPYSPEVADATIQTDRYLADFFGELDRLIGLGNVWITLSADHGIAPTPEFIREHHLGRGDLSPDGVGKAVEQALSSAYGDGHWVAETDEFYVNLDPATLKQHQVDAAKAEAVAAEAAGAVPGIAAAYSRADLVSGRVPSTNLARKVLNSFNTTRSGDVFLVPEPFTVMKYPGVRANHGTPWNYDTQVPLVLWGSAFRPGFYATSCQPVDLAATLAAALHLTLPSGAEGRPLTEALKSNPAR